MKRVVLAVVVIIVLVGACTATLLINKKKIDAKSKMDGNIKNIPVFVQKIRMEKIPDNFLINGTFSAIHELTLASEGQGKVVSLLFTTGDIVREGQVLARLDDELIRSNLSLAEASFVKLKSDLQKDEGLLKADAISSQQVEDVRLMVKKAETDVVTLKKQMDNASIKAPIAGTIVKRYIETGSLVMPGSMIADIVDISRLKFIANVSESEAVRINKGLKIALTSSLFQGIEYQGTVSSVGTRADESRRFPVEIELVNNLKYPLKAGMFGSASFGFNSEHEALVIPRHSIVGSIRDPKVYVVENNIAVLRNIRIGSATDESVEILDGLREGEYVVTSGQINLDNNTPVAIVNNK
ncbi:MAG: efflux RND transporter periplasmic adaptor subunit [Bacteroidetes bacterium]|nr:efflux RND transporter periplasmic adaptor subunit [Bacteroidota bacterium]